MASTTWVDGESHDSLSLTDRALHYGDGLFETIAVVGHQPRLLQSHLERLQKGCLRLKLPFDNWSELTQELEQLAEPMERGVIKCIISRGSGGRGYRLPETTAPRRILLTSPWPDYPDDPLTDGAHLRLCHTTLGCNPQLAGIKHLNRLEQVLARAEWDDPEIDEGIMLNGEGQIVEGTMSNIFWGVDGVLVTPEMYQCGVEGVMRREVLECAQQLGIELSYSSCGFEELKSVDELFITNSLMGRRAVHQLEERHYSTGVMAQRIYRQLQQRVAGI